MLLCVSRAIKIIFIGAYIGKLAELSLNVPTLVSPLVPYGYLY